LTRALSQRQYGLKTLRTYTIKAGRRGRARRNNRKEGRGRDKIVKNVDPDVTARSGHNTDSTNKN
jgi:hypothetical protein